MKKVSEEVMRVLQETAREVERLLAVHDGIHGHIAAALRHLRDGDLVGALRANQLMSAEQMTAAQIHVAIMTRLSRVVAMDPELWKDVSDKLDEERRAAERRRFADAVEEWSLDDCRAALEAHIESCDSPRCWIAPILEERIARHEPH